MRDYLLRVRTSAAHAAYKRVLDGLIDLRPGEHVLDLGCGLGEDLPAMQARVGPAGRVVGLERDLDTLRAGPAFPRRVVGDGAVLPFPDGSFDLVRIDRVLHLLDAPEAVVAAAAAVLRPGGRLVVAEPLWSSLSCPAVDSPGADQVAALLAEGGGQPAGRVEAALELPRMATTAGLVVERVLPGEATFPDVEEAFDLLHIERRLAAAMLARRLPVAVALGWLQAQRALGAQGAFLARMEGRTLIARKP